MAQIFHRSFNVLSKVSIFGAVFIAAGIGWAISRYIRSPYATDVGVAIEQPIQFSHEHHVGQLGIDCRYCHTSVEHAANAGIPSTKICMNCHSQIWLGSPALAPVRESYRTGRSLEWIRVHNLEDFCYFPHGIHVQKGIGCVSCHGRVDHMPLVWKVSTLHMEWCMECHRNPERHVRPREEVFSMTWEAPTDPKELEALGRRLGLSPPPATRKQLGEALVQKYGIRKGGGTMEILTSCSTCHR